MNITGYGKALKNILKAFLFVTLALPVSTQAAAQKTEAWKAHSSESGKHRFLIVENGFIRAEFLEEYAWKLAKVSCEGIPVISWTGSNGTVVRILPQALWERPQKDWIGSGHGGENLISYSVETDGTSHPFSKDMSLKGTEIRLVKKSGIGPFIFNHTVSFPASGDRIVQEHRYTVREGTEYFVNMYAFMHLIIKPFNEWTAWHADSTSISGKTGAADGSRSLETDVQAVAFYNRDKKMGVLVAYGETYPGLNGKGHFINDRSKDNKLYFQPDIRKEKLKVGDEYTFRAVLLPFYSESEKWQEKAEKLLAGLKTERKHEHQYPVPEKY